MVPKLYHRYPLRKHQPGFFFLSSVQRNIAAAQRFAPIGRCRKTFPGNMGQRVDVFHGCNMTIWIGRWLRRTAPQQPRSFLVLFDLFSRCRHRTCHARQGSMRLFRQSLAIDSALERAIHQTPHASAGSALALWFDIAPIGRQKAVPHQITHLFDGGRQVDLRLFEKTRRTETRS